MLKQLTQTATLHRKPLPSVAGIGALFAAIVGTTKSRMSRDGTRQLTGLPSLPVRPRRRFDVDRSADAVRRAHVRFNATAPAHRRLTTNIKKLRRKVRGSPTERRDDRKFLMRLYTRQLARDVAAA